MDIYVKKTKPNKQTKTNKKQNRKKLTKNTSNQASNQKTPNQNQTTELSETYIFADPTSISPITAFTLEQRGSG